MNCQQGNGTLRHSSRMLNCGSATNKGAAPSLGFIASTPPPFQFHRSPRGEAFQVGIARQGAPS